MGLFDKFRKKTGKKAVVIGLDGVPYTLLHDLKNRGLIPHMSALFDKGHFGKMSVCIPEISSVSWSSFMTGAQAGEHGIFGFMDMQQGTYQMYFPNYTNLKKPAMWDELASRKKKSVVINMPATYPAKEISGILISGFVAVDMNRAVYPSSLIPRLHEMGYRIDLDTMKARNDHDFLYQELDATLAGRERAAARLWDEIDWDLFILVITGTDRLMHFNWNAYDDESHKHHRDFIDYFKKVDALIGRFYDRFLDLDGSREDENQFYMISDHGFTKIKSEVYLNQWLFQNGFLKYAKDQPETIMDIGPGSVAFAMDPSRIYINLKDKYPMGTVSASDYDRVCREIRSGLESLVFEGKAIVKKVYSRDELYHGPCTGHAPDLVILSHHGYDLKSMVTARQVFGRTNLEGMHTQDDAFFFSSSGEKCDTIFNAKGVIEKGLLE